MSLQNRVWCVLTAALLCLGCGRGKPTEAELEAIEEGTRQAIADELQAHSLAGASSEQAQRSKEELEAQEANEIIERMIPLTKTPPAGITQDEWKTAMTNLVAAYREKAAEDYLPAARWFETELTGRTPAEVLARWRKAP